MTKLLRHLLGRSTGSKIQLGKFNWKNLKVNCNHKLVFRTGLDGASATLQSTLAPGIFTVEYFAWSHWMTWMLWSSQAPFNSGHFNAVLTNDDSKKVYRCGQNWFRHNLYWSPTAGVPCLWIEICYRLNSLSCHWPKLRLRFGRVASSRLSNITLLSLPIILHFSKCMCPRLLVSQLENHGKTNYIIMKLTFNVNVENMLCWHNILWQQEINHHPMLDLHIFPGPLNSHLRTWAMMGPANRSAVKTLPLAGWKWFHQWRWIMLLWQLHGGTVMMLPR